MIKLIVFDLDGVLADIKDIHYEALNIALEKFSQNIISREDHIKFYDGLSTRQKLKLLGINQTTAEQISSLKQKYTLEKLKSLPESKQLQEVFQWLRSQNLKIYVASNAIKKTVQLVLDKLGLIEYIDFVLSNEDVINPKPHSEIYLRCMVNAGVNPSETLIVEDSYVGKCAAIESGANCCSVNSPKDVTIEKLANCLNHKKKHKWENDNLNILIPMAGQGKRFQEKGYTLPKPLIDIRGKPMIQVVIDSIGIKANYIFLVQKEHYEKYNLKCLLDLISPNCKIVIVDGLTEGATCTTLLAKDMINSSIPLLIVNSDQYIEWNSGKFMYWAKDDGAILTFESNHPKWSFSKVEDGFITEVAEKKPISNLANCGIYYWARGSDYVYYAEQMIKKNIKVNGEFYVAPVYNEAIKDGKKIRNYNVDKFYGLGTPEDLELFINLNF